MQVQTEKAKRYAVYVFYDRDKHADEYNFYLLEELKKEVDHLLVICNGGVTSEGRARFEKIADEVLERENQGFDITAYKIGIERMGYEKLSEYDEVLVLNSTFFGPFYPFREVFETMDQKDLDFWGMTTFHEVPFDPFGTIKYGHIPTHIQSFFMVFRKSLIQSADFQSYWANMPQIHSYEEAIGFHEAIFTKEFADKGYRWAVYCDSSDLVGFTYDPLRDFPRYMIEEKRCPLLKRRSFFHEYGEAFSRSGGEGAKEALEYIEQHLPYDTDMIWDNLLRLENQADLKKRMHWNFVVSSRIQKKKKKPLPSIALVLHIYYEELADFCRRYAENMPDGTDVYVTVPNKEKLAVVRKAFENFPHRLEFRIVGNLGRDVAPFLVGCKDLIERYDLICKVHDKKVYQVKPMSLGESWAYKCFENLLRNRTFVENIIAVFEENPRLGMLTPPVPNHGPYYPTTGKGEWGENFAVAKQLADTLGLTVNLDPRKEPVAPLGSMFWVRTDALKCLFAHDWQYEEFPKEPIADDATVLHAIERIYPFCVQQEGYYPAWILADSFARIEIDNWAYINGELNRAEMSKAGAMRHRELLENIRNL